MLRLIWAVAMRDFNAVVRTKGFVIGLLFMPGVMLASVWLPKLMERFGEEGTRKFAVADFTGRLYPALVEKMAAKNAEPSRKLKVEFEKVELPAAEIAAGTGAAPGRYAAIQKDLVKQLGERARKDEIYGYALIGPRVLELPPAEGAPDPVQDDDEATGDASRSKDAAVLYGALSLTAGDMKQLVRDCVYDCVRRARLEAAGVDVEIVKRIDRRPEFEETVVSKRAGEEGVVKTSGAQEAITPIAIVILLMMGIMQSAGLLLNSTIEEKSNRVVEVLVSSITPFELLSGKIVGAWLAGMVVILAWGAAGAFAADHYGVMRVGTLSPLNLAWFTFFFLTGYLLFASLYAAIGAMCTSIQDAQSMMMPVVILIMIPMFSINHVINHPDSVLSRGLSYFPFSAPFIAVMRMQMSPPAPQWELLVSALSVSVSVLVLMWMAGKIFRIAIFMTGKPPRPSEMWRWIRES